MPLPFLREIFERSTGGGGGASADPLPCILEIFVGNTSWFLFFLRLLSLFH